MNNNNAPEILNLIIEAKLNEMKIRNNPNSCLDELIRDLLVGPEGKSAKLVCSDSSKTSEISNPFCKTDPVQHQTLVKAILKETEPTNPDVDKNEMFNKFLENFMVTEDCKYLLHVEKYVKYLGTLDEYPTPNFNIYNYE
ncbi:uncharacterized protein LOC103512493 [Diaphorina citri]|uniref:Uncharacterized protein LOC103512493 n=1 Tax=Diaphorina citri TaxID=121845 RepID=A0A1S3D6I2_DIACI|nr:uncharacterized protein LOC103512493 [Diaphorina citri]